MALVSRLEEVELCCMWAANFDVQSDSGTATYLVQFHKLEPATCTCPSYKFSGVYGKQTCKHIKRVIQYGCFAMPPIVRATDWDSDEMLRHDVNIQSISNDATGSVCPGCGLPMVAAIMKVEEPNDTLDLAGSSRLSP